MGRHSLGFNPMSRDNIFALIGLIAAMPVVYFMTGSVMKYELSLLQSVDIYTFTPAVLLGGSLLAVALNIYPVFSVKFSRSHSSCTLSFTVNLKPLNLLVLAAAALITLVLAVYLIFENLTPH